MSWYVARLAKKKNALKENSTFPFKIIVTQQQDKMFVTLMSIS